MKMREQIQGGCLCGEVRYRLLMTPSRLCDCHCLDCRRASGAPYVTWGSVKRTMLEIVQGEVKRIRYADRIRSFAGCCGTTLLFEDNDTAEWIDVTIASLDSPQSFAPEKAIWTEDRLPWVPLDGSRPFFQQS